MYTGLMHHTYPLLYTTVTLTDITRVSVPIVADDNTIINNIWLIIPDIQIFAVRHGLNALNYLIILWSLYCQYRESPDDNK